MIGSVVISRENVRCPLGIHELPRPSIFSPPPPSVALSNSYSLVADVSLFPGAKRPGHEAYHFPPSNDETKNVSLFHMHLACDQGRLYALPYPMSYVRVFIGHVGGKIDILCEEGCCLIYDPRPYVRTTSHALDVTYILINQYLNNIFKLFCVGNWRIKCSVWRTFFSCDMVVARVCCWNVVIYE